MSRRESESEDEKLKREGEGKPYLYTREQLLNIRMSELSSQRPSYLSSEFDNEEGKFVPEKWLEYRWICEGVENRPSAGARRKEKLKAEALEGDSTVLSPQRRAFSSGCRAASPVKNETESERLAANKGNWRSGAGFMMKNSSSTDFKPAFQKNAISSGDSFTKTRLTNGGSASNSNWRAAGDGAFRPNFHKDSLQGRMRPMPSCGEEKMPEWINEGPTSMSDMIELKGFDDEHKTKRPSSVKSKRETVASKQLQQAQQRAAAASTVTSRASASSATPSKDGGSRASSRGSAASSTAPAATTSSTEPPSSSAEQHPSVSGVSIPPDLAASMSPIFNGKLPNSDAEFAAIIGILGENDLDTLKQKSAISTSAPTSTPSVTGSRLSRFFATPLNTEHHNTGVLAESNDSNNNSAASRTSPGAVAVSTPSANAVLQKIFDSSPQRSAQSPAPPSLRSGVSVQGMMRVEDLERAFQREAACNASNLSTMQREAVTVDNEHLRALGLDANALNLNRHQLASSQVSKGNPLCDPHQQAHLMNRLSRFARQQEGGISQEELAAARSMLPPTGSPPSPTMRIAVPHAAAGGAAGAPQLAGQAGMQETAHKFSGGLPPDAATLHAAAFMRSQYEAAALLQGFQALAANQQRAAAMAQPPQAADLNAMRSMLAGMVAAGGMSQANVVNSAAAVTAAQPRAPSTLPSAFMPTSVMRQMTKNNALDEKHRRNLATAGGSSAVSADEDRRVQATAHPDNNTNAAPKQGGDVLTGNNMDVMTRIALQQQYAQVVAAMQGGLSMGAWRPPAQVAATMRAQALAAAQAEHQRQFAIAMMRGDLNQAQAIRARFLTQQAAAVANMPNLVAHSGQHPPQQMPTPILGASSVGSNITAANQNSLISSSTNSSAAPLKFQNPLEKLLQSAGVATCQTAKVGATNSSLGGTGSSGGTSAMPSIISRLPPSANCISVEELERQFATN